MKKFMKIETVECPLCGMGWRDLRYSCQYGRIDGNIGVTHKEWFCKKCGYLWREDPTECDCDRD